MDLLRILNDDPRLGYVPRSVLSSYYVEQKGRHLDFQQLASDCIAALTSEQPVEDPDRPFSRYRVLGSAWCHEMAATLTKIAAAVASEPGADGQGAHDRAASTAVS